MASSSISRGKLVINRVDRHNMDTAISWSSTRRRSRESASGTESTSRNSTSAAEERFVISLIRPHYVREKTVEKLTLSKSDSMRETGVFSGSPETSIVVCSRSLDKLASFRKGPYLLRWLSSGSGSAIGSAAGGSATCCATGSTTGSYAICSFSRRRASFACSRSINLAVDSELSRSPWTFSNWISASYTASGQSRSDRWMAVVRV